VGSDRLISMDLSRLSKARLSLMNSVFDTAAFYPDHMVHISATGCNYLQHSQNHSHSAALGGALSPGSSVEFIRLGPPPMLYLFPHLHISLPTIPLSPPSSSTSALFQFSGSLSYRFSTKYHLHLPNMKLSLLTLTLPPLLAQALYIPPAPATLPSQTPTPSPSSLPSPPNPPHPRESSSAANVSLTRKGGIATASQSILTGASCHKSPPSFIPFPLHFYSDDIRPRLIVTDRKSYRFIGLWRPCRPQPDRPCNPYPPPASLPAATPTSITAPPPNPIKQTPHALPSSPSLPPPSDNLSSPRHHPPSQHQHQHR